ncbi:hypothetical protein [Nannocystis punicea]|uniref:TonB C-terminal domain-containing protein n=1 Tax=Nannocystis punicea TaxID=2995304 RepID=A0ABY7GXS3_9BACT|nr:hypothetical protein [Nannocystis poenicansa]WAS91762.1 hypothetical protein O0S08_36735 [Nannocystis poenicansa]
MRTTLIFAGLVAVSLSPAACKRNSDSRGPDGCGGLCGKGTHCEAGVCVVDSSQETPTTQVVETNEIPMRPQITSWGECTHERDELPKKFHAVDDSEIPQFDIERPRVLDWSEGEEQLNEQVLSAHMREVEYGINECLGIAACYNGGSLKGGRLDMVVSLLGKTGRVDAVTVTASKHLQVFGIVPCVRKAVFDHEFPRYNGPQMTVKYNIEIGEE